MVKISSNIRKQKALTDVFDREHALELSDLVDGVDVIDPFDPIQVTLMDGIDPQKARLTLGVGPASFANLRAHWARLVELAALASVADAVAQVVQVRHRDAGEALIADLCREAWYIRSQSLFGARSGELAMQAHRSGPRALHRQRGIQAT